MDRRNVLEQTQDDGSHNFMCEFSTRGGGVVTGAVGGSDQLLSATQCGRMRTNGVQWHVFDGF